MSTQQGETNVRIFILDSRKTFSLKKKKQPKKSENKVGSGSAGILFVKWEKVLVLGERISVM